MGASISIDGRTDCRDWTWASRGGRSASPISEWTKLLSREIAEMTVESDVGPVFSAAWTRYGLGPLELNFLSCSRQTVSRSPEMVAMRQAPYFELLYARRGAIRATHGGVRSTVPQGGFIILNDQLAYELDFPDGSDCLTVRMPDDWACQWLPDIHSSVGEPIGVYNPWGRPLAGLLTAIADSGLETASLSREVIADQIGAMGSLLSSSSMVERSKTERGLCRRIRDAVRDRHDDPEISPELIAKELQISVRHLHRVLARSGISFGRFLNSVRISAAESLLLSTHTNHLQIGEIAWRVGYADQSHFARIFRDTHGCSPSDFRRSCGHSG